MDIVKKLQNPGSGLNEMARPSEIDGDLDGNYCEYYNHGVKKCHWEGNSWMDEWFPDYFDRKCGN